jgi:hypothetical protein
VVKWCRGQEWWWRWRRRTRRKWWRGRW